MATIDDWIAVDLTEKDLAEAAFRAHRRQSTARRIGARSRFSDDRRLEGDRIGALGEIAVARYEQSGDVNDDLATDRRRGYDVAGWQVRTRPNARYGLGLHIGDEGQFLLALSHEEPRIWLVGWVSAVEGFTVGKLRTDGAYLHEREWWLIEKEQLHVLAEKNGFTRRGSAWLIDPQSRFWCEVCGRSHPIIEHRLCRVG